LISDLIKNLIKFVLWVFALSVKRKEIVIRVQDKSIFSAQLANRWWDLIRV